MPTERPLPTPNQPSTIADAIQFGAVWPTYTWRKGGTDDPQDNHLYLTIGSADQLLVPEDDALIEIDPETRFIKFWGTTELLQGVSFGDNTVYGNSLIDGTVTSDKLQPGIAINGSVARLTNTRTINGIAFDGSSDVNSFAIVNTASSTARKTTSITNFRAVAGAVVTLRFTNNNTAANPTLNVSDTGEYPIRYNGTNIAANKLVNNRIYSFVFDGIGYNLIGDLNEGYTDEHVRTELVSDNNVYRITLTNNNSTATSYLQFANTLSYNPGQNTLLVDQIASNISSSWNQIHNQQGSIINSTSGGPIVGLATYKSASGVFSISGMTNGLVASFTTNDDLTDATPTHLANLLDIDGNACFPNTVKATKFEGTATVADKAISDQNGNNIANTYATKSQLTGEYLPLAGGIMTGPVKLAPVNNEANLIASTVGYVDSKVTQAVDQAKQEIIGTAGEFGTISDLTNQVTDNANNIAALQQDCNNFVRFDKAQSLQPGQQTTACNNINAVSANGGVVDGNLVVTGDLTSQSNIEIRNPNIVADQPSAEQQSSNIFVNNSDNSNDVGGLSVTVKTDNSTTTQLVAKNNSLLGTSHSISVTSHPDGTATTFVPAPTIGSDDNSIATTQWVNTTINNAIKQSTSAFDHKLYQGVLASTVYTTLEQGLGYFSKITPDDSLTSWQASYLVKITVPYNEYNAIAVLELIGIGQQYSYRYTIAHNSETVKSFDGVNFRPATTSSLASGDGHYVGLSLYRSTNPDVVGYERDIDVTVIKQENCVAELLDNIAIGSLIPNIDSTHQAGKNVDTIDTGFYYQSTINYGDRLIAWDRLPIASTSAVVGGALVGETASGNLVNIYNNGQFTTAGIDPNSIVYYSGEDLQANQTGTEKGTLYNVHSFDTAQLGNSNPLTAGSRIFLFGSIDVTHWLFTPSAITTRIDQEGYYVLLGYAGEGTRGYLIDNHPVYRYHNGVQSQVSPIPPVATPQVTSNDETIATTSFVQQVAAQITAGALVNPTVNTDQQHDTFISVVAYPGAYDKTNIAAGVDYSSSIDFYDGVSTEDPHAVGWIEHNVQTNQSSLNLAVVQPGQTNIDITNSLSVGYRKNGNNWDPIAQLSQSPDNDDNSKAIATTEYVQNNLTGICAYCNCTTPAGTPAKVGTVPKYKLVTGATVIVDFANGNTATNPTLNINNTGAKPINSGGAAIGELKANTCLMFVYTGTEYHAIGLPLNNPVITGTLTIN